MSMLRKKKFHVRPVMALAVNFFFHWLGAGVIRVLAPPKRGAEGLIVEASFFCVIGSERSKCAAIKGRAQQTR
jgi:hypothetical protein